MKSKTADSIMRYPHISQPFSRNITLSRSVSQLLYRFRSSSASNSRSRTLPSWRSPSAQSWEILSLNPFSSRPKSSDQVRVTGHPEVKWRPVVAVGTTITDRPPHRSVHARLRIRLLPRMNGVETLVGIRVQNTWVRNPPVEQWVETVPSHLRALAATN